MSPRDLNPDKVKMTESSTFSFQCHSGLPCFTQCCRDVNIYLTPYDIARLRRALGISSSEFLATYTRNFLAKEKHVPIVQLAMTPDSLYCKLVTDEGCMVYSDRPWACRMYPLDLGGRAGEYEMIVGKEKCLGLKEPQSSTVEEWLRSQGVEPYVEMDGLFQTVIPKEILEGGKMDPGLGKLVFLAYDLDRFAEMLSDERFQSFYGIDQETLKKAQEDDETLLRLACSYIRSQLEDLV